MSITRWASRYECDFCGAAAGMLAGVQPEGWLLTYGAPAIPELRLIVETRAGLQFGDCCPDCQQISLEGLLLMLAGRLASEPAR